MEAYSMYTDPKKEEVKGKAPFRGLRNLNDSEVVKLIASQYKEMELSEIVDSAWRYNSKAELRIKGRKGILVLKNS